jgi:hypothetical protein
VGVNQSDPHDSDIHDPENRRLEREGINRLLEE